MCVCIWGGVCVCVCVHSWPMFTCLRARVLALSLAVPVSQTQMAVLVPPVMTSLGLGQMAHRILPHSDRHSYTITAYRGRHRAQSNHSLQRSLSFSSAKICSFRKHTKKQHTHLQLCTGKQIQHVYKTCGKAFTLCNSVFTVFRGH